MTTPKKCNKNESTIVFELCLGTLQFPSKRYFEKTFPQLNVVLTVNFDDNEEEKEYIFYEYNETYSPFLKMTDNDKYSLTRAVSVQKHGILKLTFTLHTLVNNKLLLLVSNKLFVSVDSLEEGTSYEHMIYLPFDLQPSLSNSLEFTFAIPSTNSNGKKDSLPLFSDSEFIYNDIADNHIFVPKNTKKSEPSRKMSNLRNMEEKSSFAVSQGFLERASLYELHYYFCSLVENIKVAKENQLPAVWAEVELVLERSSRETADTVFLPTFISHLFRLYDYQSDTPFINDLQKSSKIRIMQHLYKIVDPDWPDDIILASLCQIDLLFVSLSEHKETKAILLNQIKNILFPNLKRLFPKFYHYREFILPFLSIYRSLLSASLLLELSFCVFI